jgi:predicted TIM-barrel fold metal-dependent hydrolase
VEEILEPDIQICDPHHHLWDRPGDRFLIDDLVRDVSSGHQVVRTVFVECGSSYRSDGDAAFRPVGETEFVVASDPDQLVGGIVGFADLRQPEVADVLAAHINAGRGRFRGIRNISAFDKQFDLGAGPRPLPGLLRDPRFRSGLAPLERFGLTFDAWLYHPQLGELIDLARHHPGVQIILDHLGGPIGVGPYRERRDEVMSAWQRDMTQLAACPNVVVKLGGIGMPMFGTDWHLKPGSASSGQLASRWGGTIRWCIERFGVERCMFESNFPVDRVSCSYPVLWNTFKLIVREATASEKAQLFHDTAVRVYGL